MMRVSICSMSPPGWRWASGPTAGSPGARCRTMRTGSMRSDNTEYLPLSYLSQTAYCPRRAGLLLNERIWVESADTAKGRREHERVHTRRIERRGSQIKLFEYSVFSDVLGVLGKCDLIEAQASANGCRIPAVDVPVLLYPVEYKHGNLRDEQEYNIQLCAPGHVSGGNVPHRNSRGRHLLSFFSPAANRGLECVAAPTGMGNRKGASPDSQHPHGSGPARYSPRCNRCSLREYCMPGTKQSARTYCEQLAQEARRWKSFEKTCSIPSMF